MWLLAYRDDDSGSAILCVPNRREGAPIAALPDRAGYWAGIVSALGHQDPGISHCNSDLSSGVVANTIRVLVVADSSRIGHAFRKNTAGAFGPDLARKLSQLVKMEKNVMRSMELVARERMEVAVCDSSQYSANAGELMCSSNNCPSGARPAMRTCRT